MPVVREPSQARTQGAFVLFRPDATEDAAWRSVIARQAPPSIAGRITSPQPQHLLDGARVAVSDGLRLAEAPLPLRGLVLHFVAPHRVPAQQLPAARQLEPL